MQLTVVAQPHAVDTVCIILNKAGLGVTKVFPQAETGDLSKFYRAWLPDSPTAEATAGELMEMLREVDGVEAAYIKPRDALADWKVIDY